MSKPFYNTINLEGEKLQYEVANALKQEQLIQAIYEANPYKEISPSRVLHIFHGKYNKFVPVTSVRRAITNLTDKGILDKTDNMVTGDFAKPEHTWKLSTQKWFTNYQDGNYEEKQIVQSKLFD